MGRVTVWIPDELHYEAQTAAMGEGFDGNLSMFVRLAIDTYLAPTRPFCATCEQRLSREWTFCPTCGTQVEAKP